MCAHEFAWHTPSILSHMMYTALWRVWCGVHAEVAVCVEAHVSRHHLFTACEGCLCDAVLRGGASVTLHVRQQLTFPYTCA